MLDLIERHPSPAQPAALSEKQLGNRLADSRRAWADAGRLRSLEHQRTVVVLGTLAATVVLPRLAQQLAALRVPLSRAYHALNIIQRRRHNEALIALARRRCDVLFAMLRDGTLYGPPANGIH